MHLRLAATAAFALASCLPGMAWARMRVLSGPGLRRLTAMPKFLTSSA